MVNFPFADMKPDQIILHETPPDARRARGFQTVGAAEEKFLAEALEELGELDEYAAESGLPPPSPNAVRFARRILEKVVRAVPLYYSVSPGEGGKVAIQAGDGRENAVSLLCDAAGGASCYVSVDGENRRAHYDSAGRLPDSFVLDALRQLGRDDE